MDEARVDVIVTDPTDPLRLYAASGSALYSSVDGGMHWSGCFRAPGHAAIRHLAVDPFDSQHLLAATDNGLYGSGDGAEHWRRLFREAGSGESRCQVVRFHPTRRHEVLVGTAGGVFQSVDGGRTWQAVGAALNRRAIVDLAIEAREPWRVYALTDQGLFVSADDLEQWERRFEMPSDDALDAEEGSLTDEPPEEAGSARQPTALALDPQQPLQLYLATSNGLFVTHDGAASWQRVSEVGLGTSEIRHVLLVAHSPVIAYVATSQGVARSVPQEHRWELLYRGLPTQARYLASTPTKLFAATDDGLYTLNLTPELLAQGQWPAVHEILANFVHEPTIKQVQESAIRYAEVQPQKIRQWRKQAALQALLPSVDFTFDRDKSVDDSIDEGSFPNFQVIPTRDMDRNWDFTVEWDLGELIWNDDQTSIDVRSRLMVQLRDDILDEVTRAYFERRRLQLELLTDPPTDPKVGLDKELRLQELTAILDGLTGGWFSRSIAPLGGSS